MKILTALLFLLAASVSAYAESSSTNEFINQVNFSVNGNCSATLIDKENGKLLTAAHCVSDLYEDVEREVVDDKGEVTKKKFRVKKPGFVRQIDFRDHNPVRNVEYPFLVLKSEQDTDLALIQVKTSLPNTIAADIACKTPDRTSRVFAIGNPFGVLYASYTEGVISSVDRSYALLGIDNGSLKGLIQSTAPVASGSSGGGLFNEQREIVGVNVRGLQPGFSALTLSVPTEDIRKFLELPECQ